MKILITGGCGFLGSALANYLAKSQRHEIVVVDCVGLLDVVKGHIQAAEKGRVGQRYILGGENLSYKELFEKIAFLVKSKKPRFKAFPLLALPIANLLVWIAKATGKIPLFTPEMIKASSVFCFYSNEKAKKELGFSPKPLDHVLHETIDFLSKHHKL